MTRFLLLALFVAPLLPTAAAAADRRWDVGSFDRLRVDGPFEVRVATGAAPRASASGDPRVLERLAVNNNGGTLTVRLSGEGWRGIGAAAAAQPTVVTLSSPRLLAVTLTSPARVSVAGMKAERVTLSVTGTGTLAVTGIEAEEVITTLVGTGAMTLAGRAQSARLTTNGPGLVDAAALTTGDLTVLLDGAGETRAAARFNAQVTSTGLGKVTVTGNPRCTVRAAVNGPVTCGTAGR